MYDLNTTTIEDQNGDAGVMTTGLPSGYDLPDDAAEFLAEIYANEQPPTDAELEAEYQRDLLVRAERDFLKAMEVAIDAIEEILMADAHLPVAV